MNTRAIASLACAAVALSSAFAQTGERPMAMRRLQFSGDGRPERLFMPRAGINAADQKIMRDAWAANQFEILTSQMAVDKGSSSYVKDFAKEMLLDHKAAQAELQQIAESKGVTLPSQLPAKLEANVNMLSRMSGSAFDNGYMKAQMEGHQMTSMKLKSYLRAGHDEDVRAYVEKTLPTVVLHIKHLKTHTTAMGVNKAQHGI